MAKSTPVDEVSETTWAKKRLRDALENPVFTFARITVQLRREIRRSMKKDH